MKAFHHIQKTNKGRRKGFSLIEVMVAMTIFGFVMYGLVQFNFQTTRLLYDSAIRMDVDAQMRRFSQTIAADMKTADAFYLYTDFQSSNRNSTDGTDRLDQGTSGDFLVFVYTEPQPNINSTVYVKKIVGYFRKPSTAGSPTTRGPVYRFQLDYADQTVNAITSIVETLVSTQSYDDTYTQMLPPSLGVYDNRMFYNQLNTGVMIGADLYSGNAARSTTQVMRLMVSP